MTIRRLRAAAAAAVLTLTLGLTACSSDDDATKTASTASADAATECTFPLADAKTGDTINEREFAICQAEAIAKLEGYRLTRVVVGNNPQELITTIRVQVDPLVVEMDVPQASGVNAKAVVIEGKVYVKLGTSTEYVEVAEDTTDSELILFATLPSQWEKTVNPKIAGEETEPGQTYAVVGTDKVDGADVTVLERMTFKGTEIAKKTVYVDSRFLTLTSVFTVTRSSEPDKVLLQISEQMSEIGQPQDIADPRSAN